MYEGGCVCVRLEFSMCKCEHFELCACAEKST